ncbi:MAG: uracil-DNA glycosylase [Thermicanus sp.]|nr:uracil-DNA glycosylase [Thermicanus sp.]
MGEEMGRLSILKNDWAEYLQEEFHQSYYLGLRQFLIHEYTHYTIYPDMYEIYEALHRTPYQKTKVVILGQDPYHQPGQAHGLSFSVKPGITPPPSLLNIYKELRDDLGVIPPEHGYLGSWAEQGVLLLNSVLTVRRGMPNSHRGKGWEKFTDRIIQILGAREEPTVFILWGKYAQEKGSLITGKGHLIISSPHPSPYSAHRGFFGSRPFSRANQFLKSQGRGEIDWSLPILPPLERTGRKS